MDTGKNFSANSGQTRLSPEQAQTRWAVKKDAYYTRLKALGIRHKKDESGAYLDEDQIARLDRLHEHISSGGSIADYRENSSEITAIAPQSSRGLSSNSTEKVDQSVKVIDFDLAKKLDRSAQSVAASFLADARNRITAGYLQDPDSLDEDLKNQIFLEMSPIQIDQNWAGAHLEAAIAAVLADQKENMS